MNKVLYTCKPKKGPACGWTDEGLRHNPDPCPNCGGEVENRLINSPTFKVQMTQEKNVYSEHLCGFKR